MIWIILDCSGLCIKYFLGLAGIIKDYMWLSGTVCDYFWLPWTPLNYYYRWTICEEGERSDLPMLIPMWFSSSYLIEITRWSKQNTFLFDFKIRITMRSWLVQLLTRTGPWGQTALQVESRRLLGNLSKRSGVHGAGVETNVYLRVVLKVGLHA